ncbi:MAG: FCD domain-containing protein [Rubrivivax sp.]|jgi:GntR family transcriptional repressor for pyruvate dehydrogenase complex
MVAAIALSPVKRRKVHEDIAAQLEELITSGVLREGDALPAERTLMAQFSVGRPAVREALLALERGGLLRVSNGTRAIVSRPTTAIVLDGLSASVRVAMATDEGMRNFQSARILFEAALARQAARRATPAQIDALHAALVRNERAIGDTSAFERTDVEFHYEIARIVGNPLFVGMHEALVGWLTEQRSVALRSAEMDHRAYRHHKAIFDAMAARDPDAAERAIELHLNEVVTAFWKIKAEKAGVAGG